jgi:hypothetical protein
MQILASVSFGLVSVFGYAFLRILFGILADIYGLDSVERLPMATQWALWIAPESEYSLFGLGILMGTAFWMYTRTSAVSPTFALFLCTIGVLAVVGWALLVGAVVITSGLHPEAGPASPSQGDLTYIDDLICAGVGALVLAGTIWHRIQRKQGAD